MSPTCLKFNMSQLNPSTAILLNPLFFLCPLSQWMAPESWRHPHHVSAPIRVMSNQPPSPVPLLSSSPVSTLVQVTSSVTCDFLLPTSCFYSGLCCQPIYHKVVRRNVEESKLDHVTAKLRNPRDREYHSRAYKISLCSPPPLPC